MKNRCKKWEKTEVDGDLLFHLWKNSFLLKKKIFSRFFAFFRVPGGTQVSLKSPEVGPKKPHMGLCGPLGAPEASRDAFWSHFRWPRGGIWGSPGTPWGYFFDTNSSVFDFHEFSRNSQFLSRKLPAKNMKWQLAAILSQKKQTTVQKQQTAATSNKQEQTAANTSKQQHIAANSSK